MLAVVDVYALLVRIVKSPCFRGFVPECPQNIDDSRGLVVQAQRDRLND